MQGAWILEGVALGDGDEVANSAAARLIAMQGGVVELEQHAHNKERWLGKKAVQSATDWADDSLLAFQAISGNNVYGADPNDEAQVIGSDDTPITAASLHFDIHSLLITDSSSQTTSKLRIVWGTGTMADAIAADQFVETMFHLDTLAGQVPHAPVTITMPKMAIDTKVWVQHWNATDNATIDFLVSVHEYDV